jgi:hypothetical protein
MIYPSFGVSIFAHMAIVAVGKTKNFLGFKKNHKNTTATAIRTNVIEKIFLSFFIAAIIEIVLFFVVGSSLLAIYVGATSSKSNFNIIKNIYEHETKSITQKCSVNKICYIPDAINVPG